MFDVGFIVGTGVRIRTGGLIGGSTIGDFTGERVGRFVGSFGRPPKPKR